MITTMSDKALIYEIQGGNTEALAVLARRFGYPVGDAKAVCSGIKRLKVPSVTAAKRIIAANVEVPA